MGSVYKSIVLLYSCLIENKTLAKRNGSLSIVGLQLGKHNVESYFSGSDKQTIPIVFGK